MKVDISVILPAYNEAENLPTVIEELRETLGGTVPSYEVIVVDDGSIDDTRAVMRSIVEDDPRVRYVRLRRNFGKSTALQAGFERAGGAVVVLMDADGQDDPHEILRLMEALKEGAQLVTGQRVSRQDRFVKRTTSRLFNRVTARVTGVEGRDFNSGLKAMTGDVSRTLSLYGELHRYIPVLAHWAGFRVHEVPVNHRPRRHGETKFGGARFWRGMLDLMTVQFLTRFTARPLHLFGGIALFIGAGGVGLLSWMVVLRVLGHGVGDRPALQAGILLVVVSMQLFSIGLLAEFIAYARGRTDVSRMIDDEA